MSEPFQFAELLNRTIHHSGYSLSQLARLSGVPKMTIVNWLAGRVKKPRQWHDLIKLSKVLRLNQAEVTALLESVGYPALVDLMAQNQTGQEHALLAPWHDEVVRLTEKAPFQAIADLPNFVGREKEVQALKQVLLSGKHVMICSLQGMGGVGKTTLAAHIAYELRPYFPDGVLWARLDGSDSMSILNTFANAYGHNVSHYSDLNSRSQVVRNILAHKRALIILDNASHNEEIQPLLPPSGLCAVLITTRRHDLAAVSGVYRLDLGPFDRERREALVLFERLLGVCRVEQECEELMELAEWLGHLPLAVAIVANRLAYEPDWHPADFLRKLRQTEERMSELSYGGQSVQLSFNVSYDALSSDLQRFFGALSTFSTQEFGIDAVASVAQVTADEALSHLRKLYALSLVAQARPLRYHLHPLLRDFARTKLEDSRAFERMVEFYIGFAESHASMYEQLDAELDNVIVALQVAFERGLWAQLTRGVKAISPFWMIRGLYTLATTHLDRAKGAAQVQNDSEALTVILLQLGRIALRRGNYDQAGELLNEGLTLARALEHDERTGALLTELGVWATYQGKRMQAKVFYQESLALARRIGHAQNLSTVLSLLGIEAIKSGEYRQAEAYLKESLAQARELGRPETIVKVLNNLGTAFYKQGKYALAEGCLKEGLTLARQVGYLEVIISLLSNLGDIAMRHGAHVQAQLYLQEGLALAREIDHPEKISGLLMDLGYLARLQKDAVSAESCFQEALTIAEEIGNMRLQGWLWTECGEFYLEQHEVVLSENAFNASLKIAKTMEHRELEALALFGLARVMLALNARPQACQFARESLIVLEGINHTRVAEVAQWLEAMID